MLKGLTKKETQQLLLNSKESAAHHGGIDHKPVVKYFYMQATWLITELDENGQGFALCDLGAGFPELGYIDAEELNNCRSWGGIQKDRYFKADRTISEYAKKARNEGAIYA